MSHASTWRTTWLNTGTKPFYAAYSTRSPPGASESWDTPGILQDENPPVGDAPTTPQQALDRRAALDYANACTASDYLRQPKTQPFFLSVGLNSTHFDLPLPASDINPNYIQPPPTLPDNAVTRSDMAGFHTLARQADQCFGLVLDTLRQTTLADDTLVLFTTDHGVAFPWMKCTLYDTGIGVALILRFPGGKHSGIAMDALVSHLDVFPTLCAIAGLPMPDWLEGHSLLPLLDGQTDRVREDIFAEVTYHAAYEPMRCIRTERYKYIRYFDDFSDTVKPNIDWSPSKDFLIENGLRERPHDPPEMLFDLYFDPAERANQAGNPRYASIRSRPGKPPAALDGENRRSITARARTQACRGGRQPQGWPAPVRNRLGTVNYEGHLIVGPGSLCAFLLAADITGFAPVPAPVTLAAGLGNGGPGSYRRRYRSPRGIHQLHSTYTVVQGGHTAARFYINSSDHHHRQQQAGESNGARTAVPGRSLSFIGCGNDRGRWSFRCCPASFKCSSSIAVRSTPLLFLWG